MCRHYSSNSWPHWLHHWRSDVCGQATTQQTGNFRCLFFSISLSHCSDLSSVEVRGLFDWAVLDTKRSCKIYGKNGEGQNMKQKITHKHLASVSSRFQLSFESKWPDFQGTNLMWINHLTIQAVCLVKFLQHVKNHLYTAHNSLFFHVFVRNKLIMVDPILISAICDWFHVLFCPNGRYTHQSTCFLPCPVWWSLPLVKAWQEKTMLMCQISWWVPLRI